MTGTRRDQPLPRQDCVGYLLNLKPGADLTAEDLARLARLDDGPFDPDQHDDPYGAGFDPDTCPPEGWELLSWAEQQRWLNGDADRPAVPEVFDAGFTHRVGGDSRGFAAGGALDQMEPGATLTTFTERAWEKGLDLLSDDERCAAGITRPNKPAAGSCASPNPAP
jgi:hypothetical protein